MVIKNKLKVNQGKRNRINGANFERKVREDLEKQGYIVSKWGNNIQTNCKKCHSKMTLKSNANKYFCKQCNDFTEHELTKQIPASPGIFRMMQTGFPDFIAYKHNRLYFRVTDEISVDKVNSLRKKIEAAYKYASFDFILTPKNVEVTPEWEIIFVESKTNGYLDKIEKEKVQWYLKNNICTKFLVASKEKINNKVKVKYKEIKNE